ncbi:MAG: hypothetical protein ACFE0O_01445 [Opitutales bacterium]
MSKRLSLPKAAVPMGLEGSRDKEWPWRFGMPQAVALQMRPAKLGRAITNLSCLCHFKLAVFFKLLTLAPKFGKLFFSRLVYLHNPTLTTCTATCIMPSETPTSSAPTSLAKLLTCSAGVAASTGYAAVFTVTSTDSNFSSFFSGGDGDNIITPSDGTVQWDVDGDGKIDFWLIGGQNTFNSGVPYDYVDFFGPQGTNKFISFNAAGGVRNISANFMVGPTLATDYGINGSGLAIYRYTNVATGVFYSATNFTDGVNGFIGFSFDSSGAGAGYGWAEVRFDLTNTTLTILQWSWEADNNTAIQVGTTGANPIPEPATTAAGLGLLALGAAGLRCWRKKQPTA